MSIPGNIEKIENGWNVSNVLRNVSLFQELNYLGKFGQNNQLLFVSNQEKL